MSNPDRNEFERASADHVGGGGLLKDLWGYLRENKKWWLLPIIVMLLGFGLLVFLSGTVLAPFIYTMF